MSIDNDPFSEIDFKSLNRESAESLGRDLGRLLFRDPERAWNVASLAELYLRETADVESDFTNGSLNMLCAIVAANRAEYQEQILRNIYTQHSEDHSI